MTTARHVEPIEIAPLLWSDLVEVVAIDATSDPAPWSLALFEQSLQVGHLGHKALCAGQMVGYSLTQLVQDEAELLRIAVLADFRRAGLGRALLSEVIAVAIDAGCRRLLLEVRSGNQAAIALYQQAGFRTVGQRRGYYPALPGGQQREDALLMALDCAPRQ